MDCSRLTQSLRVHVRTTRTISLHACPFQWWLTSGVCTPALAAHGVFWSVDHVFRIKKRASWRVGGTRTASRRAVETRHNADAGSGASGGRFSNCSTRRRTRPPNAPTGALFDTKNVVYAPNNPGGREGASMGRAHAARRPPVCGMHVHDFNQLSLLVEKIQSSHTTKPVGWRHAACRELFRTGLKSC